MSRQHLVDLCDSRRIDYVKIGTHRRIPAETVVRFLGRSERLSADKARSLWLHRAIVGALVTDPERVLAIGRANVERSLSKPSRSEVYEREWLKILDQCVDALVRACLDESDHGCDLRPCTLFAGVLDDQARPKVLRASASSRRHEPQSARWGHRVQAVFEPHA